MAVLIAAGRGRFVAAESVKAQQPAAHPAHGLAPLILDDDPQPLQQQQPRSEADRDRLEALSLFTTARALEQREQFVDALRLYQRAFRCDPQAVAVVRAIIPLAFRLKRHAEAVRYALKAAEIEETDPVLLRRLGLYVTEEGEWQQAIKLYERAFQGHSKDAHGDDAHSDRSDSGADVLLRMEMGRLYYLLEDYQQAAACFDRVLYAVDHPKEAKLDEKLQQALLAEPGPTYSLIGECFLLADRPQDAIAAFQQGHHLAPNKGLLEFHLARVDLRSGKPGRALEALERCYAEKLSSEGTAPYDLLGEVLEKLGKKDELVGRLEKLYAAEPGNIRLGYALARRYFEAGQTEKAAPLYRQLLKKSPALAGYRNLAEICRKTRDFAGLLAVLGDAVEKGGVLEAMGAEGQQVARDAESMHGLVETAHKKLQAQPEQLDYGMRLAIALLAMEAKQYETAGEFFELALKAKPAKAAELILVWGVGLLVDEHAVEAAAVFQRGIRQKALPQDNPLFHFYLAGALAMQHHTDEALAAARKGAKLKPDAARFASRVGWVLYQAKRNDEAIKSYAELIARFEADYGSPETRDVLREARLALSNLCVLEGRPAEAEEWLEQVLDEFPDDVGAANDLGYLWADQDKHLRRALPMIERAVAAEPDNSAYRDSLGWVYYRLGRYDEALAELKKAVADRPEGVVLDHLGDAYLRSGQPQQAKDAWRRAAEALEKEKETQKADEVKRKLKTEDSRKEDNRK